MPISPQKNDVFFNTFEKMLRRVRYLVLFPIVFLVLALVYLIILMGERVIDATGNLLYQESPLEVLVYLIDIVDFTLIAVIILLIIRGVYELFIRPMSMDIHRKVKADGILIHDIDELKQKLGKVIIISLVVHIFKQILVAELIEPLELLI